MVAHSDKDMSSNLATASAGPSFQLLETTLPVESSFEEEADADSNHPHQEQQQSHRPQAGVDADFDIDDNCELVMSYKCKHCSFLARDKSTLVNHIRNRHVGRVNGKRHRHKSNTNNTTVSGQEELQNVGFDVSKIKMNKREIFGKEEMPPVPSIPPTPEAYFVMSDEEDDEDNSCQLVVPSQEDNIEHPDPLEMDDVFLCAECDIVFASKELCCRHMHDIHGLEQFSAEFIQQVIISKRPEDDVSMEAAGGSGDDECSMEQSDKNKTKPGEDEVETTANNNNDDDDKTDNPKKRNLRKRIKPPKHLTLEEGSIVPKRFRVSKTLTFCCSKCLIKYESEKVMKLHESCHIGLDEKIPKQEKSDDEMLIIRLKNNNNHDDEEDDDERYLMGEEVDPNQPGVSRNNNNYYKFKCPICISDNPPTNQQNETQHQKSGKISKYFTKWSNTAGHLWREHQIDCELYTCTVCKSFKNYYITKVKDHEQLHRPDANYMCNICNKKFKQRHQLTTHQKYHKEKVTRLPPPTDSRWYTPKECHICKRILSDAKCLKKHISAVHNKLKPYCCNICGHTTARKAELRLHVRQHTGEKPFKCIHCPFVTGDHNSLRKHKLRHGNQKSFPYSCPYCDYRCIQASAFKKHIVSIHPDQDVVFQCHICPHASVNEGVASAHVKDHEEGRIASTSLSLDQTNSNSTTGSSSSSPQNDNDNSNSSSSSNEYPEIGIRSFGRRRPPVRKPKSPQKPRWLLEDDSVDIIDTGGVTIPASPPPEAVILNSTDNNNASDSTALDDKGRNPQTQINEAHESSCIRGDLTTVNLEDIA